MDWKERFEKLFPSSFLNGRDFKKAELKKLEKILSQPKAKLNEEELLTRRMVRTQYQQLERTLYPNTIVRLIRNTGKLTVNTIRWSAKQLRNRPRGTGKSRVKSLKDSEVRDMIQKDKARRQVVQHKSGEEHQQSPAESKNRRSTVILQPDFSKREKTRGKRLRYGKR